MFSRPRFAAGAFHAALILLAAIGAGAATLGNDFVFDDHMLLGGSAPVILGDAPLLSAFASRYWGAAEEASPTELYRPVTIASLGLSARLAGRGPAAMHAVNILLHAANAFMAYGLIRALFGRPWLALLTSLIFAVHPIATEAVAPASGRADLLAALFTLAACLCALAACRRRGGWRMAWGIGSAALVLLGALSKENVFAAPLATISVLLAGAMARPGDREGARARLAAGGAVITGQIVALLAALLARLAVLGYIYGGAPLAGSSASYLAFVNNPLHTAGLVARALTSLKIAMMAGGLLLFPLKLSADYSFNQIPVSGTVPGPAEIAALILVLLYAGAIVWSVRRSPVVTLGLAWMGATYLIVSNLLFPIGTIFGERLLYLPSFGLALLAAAAITRMAGAGPRARIGAIAVTSILLSLLGARFIARCRDWADDDRLFAATVAASPASARAHSNHGFTLQREGRHEEAIASYTRALQIAPGLTGARVSLAALLSLTGRLEESMAEFKRALETDGGLAAAWSGLGAAQEAASRPAEAEASYRKVIELSRGGDVTASRGLGRVLALTDREEQAVDLLERLLKDLPGEADLRGDLAQAHYLLGVRRLKEDRREEFLEEMNRTVHLDPGHGPAHYNLSLAALEQGDTAAARRHAEAGLSAGYQFPPGFLEAMGMVGAPARR